jgi:hypothetical protein
MPPQSNPSNGLPAGYSLDSSSAAGSSAGLPTGYTLDAGTPTPNPVGAPSQPSAWQVLNQPTEKTDNEYLGYTGLPGIVGATIHGLNEVGQGTLGAIKGAAAMFDPRTQPGENSLTKIPAVRAIQPLVNAARQVPQIPGALRDIMGSEAPSMYLGQAAEKTAGQGAGQALTGIASEGLPKAIDLARTVVPKVGEVAVNAAKASGVGLSPIEKLTKAGGPSVRTLNFPETLQTAAPELARQNAASPIKSVQDVADAAHTGANRIWTEQIEPQIQRNASAKIDGTQIANQIRSGVGEGMTDLFPEQAKAANSFADKFEGPLTLAKSNEYLKTLNAQLKSFYKMSPEARAAAGVTDGRISSMENAADGLRQQMYSKLDSLGEQDPAGLRQQYGALKNVQDVFQKRAIVAGRQAPLNLQQIIGLSGGLGEATGAVASGHPMAALGGVAAAAVPTILKYFNSPDMLAQRGIRGLEVPPEANTATPLRIAPPAGTTPPAIQPEASPVPGPLKSALSEGGERRLAPRGNLSPEQIIEGIKQRGQGPQTVVQNTEGAADLIKRSGVNNRGESMVYSDAGGEPRVTTLGGLNGSAKIGELVGKDIGNGTIEVTSNQIYGKNLQGVGRGTDQINHFLQNMGPETKIVKSDISTSVGARGAWDNVMKSNPGAVTKQVFKDGQVQYTVDMSKFARNR